MNRKTVAWLVAAAVAAGGIVGGIVNRGATREMADPIFMVPEVGGGDDRGRLPIDHAIAHTI